MLDVEDIVLKVAVVEGSVEDPGEEEASLDDHGGPVVTSGF